MIKKLLINIFVGILSFVIGIFLIEGVYFSPDLNIKEKLKILFLIGGLLGLVNTIILPIINLIFLPIRIITLGIFNIITSMAMIIIISIFFESILIAGLWEFFLLTMVVWILSLIFSIKLVQK